VNRIRGRKRKRRQARIGAPDPALTANAGMAVISDLDATDVEVYGRKKRGVAYNHQGQRVGRPHVATWAETEITLAADLALFDAFASR
jgi:hypothetical protein